MWVSQKIHNASWHSLYTDVVLFFFSFFSNIIPLVYILSPALDGLWRENRGSVNRLSWHGYDRLFYRLSNDELTMVRLLQLEVKAGFKPGCKQVSSWRHRRRSHEKGRRQNLERRTGSDHSQRHYPLPFVIQCVTGVDLTRSVPGFVDVLWDEHVGNPWREEWWKLRSYIDQWPTFDIVKF